MLSKCSRSIRFSICIHMVERDNTLFMNSCRILSEKRSRAEQFPPLEDTEPDYTSDTGVHCVDTEGDHDQCAFRAEG
jgi:hypothetical protein